MARGVLFTAPVERIAAGGAGLLTYQGKRVFMDHTAPGDRAVGRIIEETTHWARAELVELVEASPLRTKPACPLYGICGGCSLQHLQYPAQVGAKAAILRDALARIGGIRLPEIAGAGSPSPLPFIPSSPWEYRNRMQLHRITPFHRPKQPRRPPMTASLGLMGRKSGEIIPIADCPVADPGIRSVLQEGSLLPPPDKDRFTLYSRDDTLLSEGSIRGKVRSRGMVSLGGKEIRMDAGVFFQSNGVMQERLLEDLIQTAGEADPSLPMADLYCGVGVFAACLGGHFSRVDLVEENPAALSLARENIRESAPAAGGESRLFARTGDQWALGGGMETPYGFIVADPPRQGLSPVLRRVLAQKGPPVLAYVSCDPATLARDSGELCAGGYVLERLTGYDFYPQTAHIESVAVFKR